MDEETEKLHKMLVMIVEYMATDMVQSKIWQEFQAKKEQLQRDMVSLYGTELKWEDRLKDINMDLGDETI